MATGPKKGLNPSRQVGSGVDNKGLNSYTIASGYGTQLSVGDPVKLSSGTIVKATNGDPAIGVFMGVNYIDAQGAPVFNRIWPASQVATDIDALIMDSPTATFSAISDASVAAVIPGQIYPLTLTAGSASIGRSNAVVTVSGGVVTEDAGLVKVIKVVDATNRVLEVTLLDQLLRDND